MIDHVIVTVRDVERSGKFYEQVLAPLGLTEVLDYDGALAPIDHPDLKGFGTGERGRFVFWLKAGSGEVGTTHVGFTASSIEAVDGAFAAALAAGAKDNGAPGIRDYYDPGYYAAGVLDPDGHNLEFTHKTWLHPDKPDTT
jgi:catechol 2,3-dioxygenase-like lactoylglutathione lyase family enzyme